MKEYGTLARVKTATDAEKVLLRIKDAGFAYCQLVFKPDTYTVEDAKIIKEASDKTGIKITAIFAGFKDDFTKWNISTDYKDAGINSKKYGKGRIKYVKQAAWFASQLGVEDILIHAGFVANNPYSAEYKLMVKRVTQVAKHCKDLGVNLLLETGGESPITMLRLIEDVALDNVFVNLDTANIIMYGYGNPAEAVYTLNKHIRSMHVKDGLPPKESKTLGAETPIGEGYVDFPKVFEKLNEVGFDGPVIIEREIEGEKQLEDLKNAVKFLNDGKFFK